MKGPVELFKVFADEHMGGADKETREAVQMAFVAGELAVSLELMQSDKLPTRAELLKFTNEGVALVKGVLGNGSLNNR